MKHRGLRMALCLIAALPLCALTAEYADKPENVHPLLIGAQVPSSAVLQTIEGGTTTLTEVIAGQRTVLVFFRGGWCPYCDLQLSELRLIESDLKSMGYQIVAVSPDPPAALKARKEKNELGYRLLSDHTSALIKAFGIAFAVDDATVGRFKAFSGLDEASTELHRVLPVPAVYIVDGNGKVRFQYVNPDYRIRLPKDLLMVAAKTALPASP